MQDEGRPDDAPRPIDKVEILFGQFTPLPPTGDGDGAMRLVVIGRNILNRAIPFSARVGDQPVRGLIVSPGGSGFAGFLERAPRDGDRLYVRYVDSGEIGTRVVYHAPGVA